MRRNLDENVQPGDDHLHTAGRVYQQQPCAERIDQDEPYPRTIGAERRIEDVHRAPVGEHHARSPRRVTPGDDRRQADDQHHREVAGRSAEPLDHGLEGFSVLGLGRTTRAVLLPPPVPGGFWPPPLTSRLLQTSHAIGFEVTPSISIKPVSEVGEELVNCSMLAANAKVMLPP